MYPGSHPHEVNTFHTSLQKKPMKITSHTSLSSYEIKTSVLLHRVDLHTTILNNKNFIKQFHTSCYSHSFSNETIEKTASHTILNYLSMISLQRQVDLHTPESSAEKSIQHDNHTT